eukprot:506672-Prymnesium_polylepis.1
MSIPIAGGVWRMQCFSCPRIVYRCGSVAALYRIGPSDAWKPDESNPRRCAYQIAGPHSILLWSVEE